MYSTAGQFEKNLLIVHVEFTRCETGPVDVRFRIRPGEDGTPVSSNHDSSTGYVQARNAGQHVPGSSDMGNSSEELSKEQFTVINISLPIAISLPT